MKLLGVKIDFSKHYTEAELEQLEADLDRAFGRFTRRCLRLMIALIVLAVAWKYLWQLAHN